MTLQEPAARPGLSNKARELMEAINTDAGKDNIWVRTQMNAPSQRAWFADPSGTGTKGPARVAIGQMKSAPYHWRWKEYKGYLDRLSRIAAEADVPPIEFADRQSILLTNPGLGGRLQVNNTTPRPNPSRTILSNKGGYTNVEGERCEARRGDIILTPNGTWHDHGNEDKEPV